MTRNRRILNTFRGDFNAGRRIADRQHVGTSNLAVCRACWRAIADRRFVDWSDKRKREALRALFLGALAAHKANRALFIACRF